MIINITIHLSKPINLAISVHFVSDISIGQTPLHPCQTMSPFSKPPFFNR